MIDRKNDLIELLNSYQNETKIDEISSHNYSNDNNLSHGYHGHKNEELDEFPELNLNNIVHNNKNNKVTTKSIEKLNIDVKKTEYFLYNGYRYRREVLTDDSITWEIERITLPDNSSHNISVFYRIFHNKQIEILERKYSEIN